MKNKKYHTVGTDPKLNIKFVGRDKTDTPNIPAHIPGLKHAQ
jgi:hypothetical protein